MFGSVCRGRNISKHDRGRLEKTVKKADHVVGKPLYEKRLYKKPNTHVKWAYTSTEALL